MLILSGMHQAWLQERLLTLEAQRLRHRTLAEATLQLALQDLQSPRTQADGSPNWRQQMGDATQTHVFFPQTVDERDVLRTRLRASPCREGICVTDNPLENTQALPSPSLAQWITRTDQAWTVAAKQLPDASARSACYWIEVLANANGAPFYYRITVLVQGALPGARVALQAVWQPAQSGQGHWLSWQVLAV
jgi:Tfp pilus assembly protein PilX